MTLYVTRYIYGTTIDAPSREEAYKRTLKMIEKNPGMVISAVEQANLARPKSLLMRFLTGR